MLKKSARSAIELTQEQEKAAARRAEGDRVIDGLSFSQAALPTDSIDAYGWPDTDAHFAGWAPTVSSRFTFSMVGEPQKKPMITANLEEANGTRRIAHIAKRTTRDAIFFSPVRSESSYYCYMVGETMPAKQLRPNIASRLGLEPEGGEVHQVNMLPQGNSPAIPAAGIDPEKGEVGQCDDDGPVTLKSVEAEHGKMTGFVTFFVKKVTKGSKAKDSKERRELHKSLYGEIEKTIKTLEKSTRETGRFRTWSDDEPFLDAAMQPIRNLLIKAGNYHALTIVRYEIHRSGEVRLFVDRLGLPEIITFPLTREIFNSLPAEWKEHRTETSDPIDPYIYKRGGGYYFEAHRDAFFRATADEFLKHQLTRMVEPIFDFLRDTIHRHYHHEPVDDRMVNVRAVEKTTDHKWRLDTLQWLMTTVQRRRRRGKEPHLHDALGILSYVEAFQRQLAAHKRCEKDFDKFEENVDLRPHTLSHLERSLRTELERRIKNRTTNQQIVLIFTTVLVAVIAAVQQTIGGKNQILPPAEWVGLTADFSIAHPAAAVFAWTTLAGLMAIGIYESVSERLTYGRLLGRYQGWTNTVLGAVAASLQGLTKSNRVGKFGAACIAIAIFIGGYFVMQWSYKTFVNHVQSTSAPQEEPTGTNRDGAPDANGAP